MDEGEGQMTEATLTLPLNSVCESDERRVNHDVIRNVQSTLSSTFNSVKSDESQVINEGTKLIIPKTLPDEMFKFDLSGIDVSGSFDTSSSQVENEGEDETDRSGSPHQIETYMKNSRGTSKEYPYWIKYLETVRIERQLPESMYTIWNETEPRGTYCTCQLGGHHEKVFTNDINSGCNEAAKLILIHLEKCDGSLELMEQLTKNTSNLHVRDKWVKLQTSDSIIEKSSVSGTSRTSTNYVGKLQELCDKMHLTRPEYKCVQVGGMPHMPNFEYSCKVGSYRMDAKANNKRLAKKLAALKFLKWLDNENWQNILI
jgi:hypothetical protein